MKKFLLSFLTLLLLVPLCAHADSYTIAFMTSSSDNYTSLSGTVTNTSQYLSKGSEYVASFSSPANVYPKSKNGLKFSSSKNNGQITINLSDEGKVKATSIVAEICGWNGTNTTKFKIEVDKQSLEHTTTKTAVENVEMTLDGSEISTIKFTALGGGDKRFYLSSITVNYDGGGSVDPDPGVVAKPTITAEGGIVTLACATEGAAIYYTTDGQEPTAASTLYTEPFAVDPTKDVTVKAFAINEDKESDVAELVVKKSVYAGFAELYAAGNNTTGKIQGPITVYFYGAANANRYVYVKDATGYNALIYNLQDETIVNGTTFESVEGTVGAYGGVPQLTGAKVEGKAEGTPIEPELLTVATLPTTTSMQYIKLEGVNLGAISSSNFTISQDGSEVAGRNQFSSTYTHPTDLDKKYDIVGIWTSFNNNKQFQIISATESEGQENPDPQPVEAFVSTPAADSEGTIYAQVGSTIVFQAKNATMISYEWVSSSAEGSDVIEGDTYEFTMPKEDVYLSLEATDDLGNEVKAEYILVPVSGPQSVTFDFTVKDAYGLTSTNDNNFYEKDVYNFTEGDIHIDMTSGNYRQWLKSGAYDFRVYKGANMTISAPAGYILQKIEGIPSGLGGNKTFTDPCNYVTLSGTATSNITKITVTYVESEEAVFEVPTLVDHNGNEYRNGDAPDVTFKDGCPELTFSHANSNAEIFFAFAINNSYDHSGSATARRVGAHDESFYTGAESFRGLKFAKYSDDNKPTVQTTGDLYYYARANGLASEIHQIQFSTTTGIENVAVDIDTDNAPAYNIYGQKVDKTYRGLVIRGGVKVIQ